jgi:CheY-like chemotaxis protein
LLFHKDFVQLVSNRILFVDDDADDREIFSEAIMQVKPSAVLTVCSSALQALTVLQSDSFDYIFIDYRMPGVDGRALLIDLAARTGSTRLYVCSTFMSEEEIDDCRKQGAHDCFSKGGTFHELCKKLETIFQT